MLCYPLVRSKFYPLPVISQVLKLRSWRRNTLLSKGKIFPLGKQHQRIRLKFHVLKLGTWAAGEASVLQEVKVTSWKQCINAYADSPFRSISERAFSFSQIFFPKWVYDLSFSVGTSEGSNHRCSLTTEYTHRCHPRQICKSDFCTLVFFLAFRYHIREGRRKP